MICKNVKKCRTNFSLFPVEENDRLKRVGHFDKWFGDSIFSDYLFRLKIIF